MPYCWALLLVTLETFFTRRVRARSKAKRMIRSQPFSVNSAVCSATSLPGPRADRLRPPSPAYSPSLFSRTTTQSRWVSSALRSGDTTPGWKCTGRTLAHWSKFCVMFSRSPHSVMWSGTVGQPTAPK